LMPIVEVGVIALFILITFISFRNIKKSEQHSIWIGMAKETAHQLGTPISSIMGWLELLKQEQSAGSPVDLKEIVSKMEEDLHRLEKIAHRFSQIGSIPELKETDLNSINAEVVKYFRSRLPHAGSGVCIKTDLKPVPLLKINSELVSWVIENLIKNALESVDPKQGVIEISTEADSKQVTLKVVDNGKGIPSKEQKRVFHPGYTTKKRGWGLGLSLAKRIVEDYHQGKIVLEESIPNKKTVFIVNFPISV
ncbi:MAG: sensor histidine kinase, partial [Thermodesulfobacteriota bacterium]